jgi:hypothetical protein
MKVFSILIILSFLPAEDTENQVHDEEGAEDDHRDEVHKLPGVAH